MAWLGPVLDLALAYPVPCQHPRTIRHASSARFGPLAVEDLVRDWDTVQHSVIRRQPRFYMVAPAPGGRRPRYGGPGGPYHHDFRLRLYPSGKFGYQTA